MALANASHALELAVGWHTLSLRRVWRASEDHGLRKASDRATHPLFMTYGGDMTLPSKDAGHGIHHPVYGVKLKEKSDMLGHECHLVVPGTSKSDKYATANEFLFAKLLAP